MDFDYIVETGTTEEQRSHPVARYFLQRVLKAVWERAGARANSQPGRFTGIPFLKRVVRRHLGPEATKGLTLRSGVAALAAQFFEEESADLYQVPPGGEGEEELVIEDEWLTSGAYMVSFDLLEDEELVDRIVDALDLTSEVDLGAQDLEGKLDALVGHQRANHDQLRKYQRRGLSETTTSGTPSAAVSEQGTEEREERTPALGHLTLPEREGMERVAGSHPGIPGYSWPVGAYRENQAYKEVGGESVRIARPARSMLGKKFYAKVEREGPRGFDRFSREYDIPAEAKWLLIPVRAVGISPSVQVTPETAIQLVELSAGGEETHRPLQEVTIAAATVPLDLKATLKEVVDEGVTFLGAWDDEGASLGDLDSGKGGTAPIYTDQGDRLDPTLASKTPTTPTRPAEKETTEGLKTLAQMLGASERLAEISVTAIQKALVEQTQEALTTASTARKEGHRTLSRVELEDLGRDKNPATGDQLSEHVSEGERAKLGTRALVPSLNAVKTPKTHPFCATCNGKRLILSMSKLGMSASAFHLSEDLQQCIVCSDEPGDSCSSCGSFLNPPLGLVAKCPRSTCGKMFTPSEDQFTLRCPHCALSYVGEKASEARGVLETRSYEGEEASANHRKAMDRECSSRWSYIRSRGGRNILDRLGLENDTYDQAQRSLMMMANMPSLYQGTALLPSTLDIDFIVFGIVGMVNKGYIELGASSSFSAQEKATNLQKLTLAKMDKHRYSARKLIPSTDATTRRSGNPNETVLLYEGNYRLMQQLIWGENYKSDLTVGMELLNQEVRGLERECYYEGRTEHLKAMLLSHHESYDNRLRLTLSNPHSPPLFFYERADGIVRPIPCLQSSEYCRAIPLRIATIQVQSTLALVDKEVLEENPQWQHKSETDKAAKEVAKKDKEIAELKARLEKSEAKWKQDAKQSKNQKKDPQPRTDRVGKPGGKKKEEIPLPVPREVDEDEPSPSIGRRARPAEAGPTELERLNHESFSINPPLRPGLAGTPDPGKYLHLLPRNAEGQQMCWMDHTQQGCPENRKGNTCPYAHPKRRIGPQHWPMEWHQILLHHGGHADLEGQLKASEFLAVCGEEKAKEIAALPQEQQSEALTFQVWQSVNQVLKPGAAPFSTKPIQKRTTKLVQTSVWPSEGAFPYSTSAGLPVVATARVVVGEPDAYFSGTKRDLGEEIELKGGELAPHLCLVKSLAAELPIRKGISSSTGGKRADEILLSQIVENLQQLDPNQIPEDSSLAEFYTRACALDGLPLDALRFLDPPWLSQRSFLIISGTAPNETLTFTLNICDGVVGGDQNYVVYGAKGKQCSGDKLEKRAFTPATLNSQVDTILVTTDPEAQRLGEEITMHAESFRPAGKTTITTLQRKLSRIVEAGKAKVVLQARGSEAAREGLGKAPASGGRKIPRESILAAAEKLREFSMKLFSTPEPSQDLREQVGGTRGHQRGETPEPTGAEQQHPPRGSPPISFLEEWRPELEEEWNSYHLGLGSASSPPKLQGSEDFASLWKQAYLPTLASEEFRSQEKALARALVFAAKFNNMWLRHLLVQEEATPREALLSMVAALRKEIFGTQPGALPPWEEIKEVFGKALSPQHLALLKELVTTGHDPAFLDVRGGQGKLAKANPDIDLVLRKVLEDLAELSLASQALLFGTWEADIEALLVEAGCHVSGLVTAVKKEEDGRDKVDEWQQTVYRVCLNCSDGPLGVNQGISSADHTTQKTTSHDAVAQHFLREEKRYPHNPIRAAKLDVSKAFKWVAVALDSIGTFAHEAKGFTAVHLNMIFGSAASPGAYDVLGDSIVQALLLSPRKEPEVNGPTHPEVARFVDDYLSITAMVGNRGPDHMERLRQLIRSLFGPGGLNEEKDEVTGGLSSLKQSFGVVLDTVERKIKRQWSKVAKAFDLCSEFINEQAAGLSQNQTEVLRGVLQHVLTPAPALQRLVMPRLDAGLASFDPSRRDPKALANFRLKGETKEQGTSMLRFSLRLLFALSNIDQGKLLEVSPEALLSRGARTAWPGRETPEDLISILMDASGESLFVLDLSDGEHVLVHFTEEEKALFNHFDDEYGTTINIMELWSEAIAVVMFGPKHTGKILAMVNDNTSAQSWTDRSRHRHSRVDQILVMVALSELMFKQTVWGERVPSEINFADIPTRKERQGEFEEGMAKLAQDYGWPTKQGTLLELDPWFRDFGMGMASYEGSVPRWLEYAKGFVERTETLFPGQIRRTCGVGVEHLLEAFAQAEDTHPIPRPEPEPPGEGPLFSEARKKLTGTVDKTETQFWRQLSKLQRLHGPRAGEAEFLTWVEKNHGARGDTASEAITKALQKQFEKAYTTLATENRDFDPNHRRKSSREEKGVTWSLPEGHRLAQDPNIWSLFAGLCPMGESASKSAGRVTLTAERIDRLREFLGETHPQAKHLKLVEDCSSAEVKEWVRADEAARSSEILSASVSCIPYSAANRYARNLGDQDMGSQVEDFAALVTESRPPIAHMECTMGILDRAKGRTKSAFQLFKEKLSSSYHVQVLEIDAGQTISPLDGAHSPLRHFRAHVVAFRKDLFHSPAELKLSCNEAPARNSFDAELDQPTEAPEYRCMPTEDQRSFVFKHRRKNKGAAYLGHILDPTEPLGESRGHHLFLTEAVDPLKGRAPPWTSTGGGPWLTRSLNGKQTFRLPTNREGVRLYCLGRVPEECLDNRSYLGQSIIGNAIPLNVADHIYHQILLAYSKVQSDGMTAQEKWLREVALRNRPLDDDQGRQIRQPRPLQEQAPKVGGKKGARRKETPLSPALEKKIRKQTTDTFVEGKAPGTIRDYESAVRQWKNIAAQKGWDSDLSEIVKHEPKEAVERVLLWLGYERVVHNNKAHTLRHKLSAVRWDHLRNLKPDPFKDMEPLDQWLADLTKMDGPAECKLPVPLSLLRLIFTLLDPILETSLDARVKKTALLTGFWWLLRSSEYLAGDSGQFNPERALTWKDVTARVSKKQGWVKATLQEALAELKKGRDVRISLTLFSSKNKQETCTRTLSAVQGSQDCPVANLLELHSAVAQWHETEPTDDAPVFSLEKGTVFSRSQISDILKQASQTAGIPAGRVASHSLRRGGASAFVASGASDAAIQRFGRWTSDAYKAYVFPHAAELVAAQKKAMVTVPCFERN